MSLEEGQRLETEKKNPDKSCVKLISSLMQSAKIKMLEQN